MSATDITQTRSKVNKLVSITYLTLGFVIGNLSGITEAEITIPIISGLFAFIGGSAIAMLQKIKFHDRVTASLMVLTICLGLLPGLYLGLWTRGAFSAQPSHDAGQISGLIRSDRQDLISDFIVRSKKNDWDRNAMSKELELLIKDGCKGR